MRYAAKVGSILLLTSFGRCQAAADPKFDDPKIKAPSEMTMKLIQGRLVELRDGLKSLRGRVPETTLVDVEIYLKAAEWTIRHQEFYNGGQWTVTALDRGLQRAKQAAESKADWLDWRGKKTIRAYRSRVDESIQPYSVSVPLDYGTDNKKKWRLDVVLHGRDATICETKFLAQHDGGNAPKGADFVQIEIFGRGNNAYRWAGETDVFEVIGDFITREKALGRDLIDPKRIVLRGFSMGGAGTWHLGLHHPDRWCVIGPGAGFTTTHAYVKSLPNPLPPDQEPLLHIYDAVDYAENAFDVPIVAYSGEKDPQQAAADNIEKRLKELKIDTMTHLIAPGLMHQFPAPWQAKAEQQYARFANLGRPEYPSHIRFVTYTLKYPRCDWIELLQLEKHYAQAHIDATFGATGYRLTTRNVNKLKIVPKPGEASDKWAIIIDGEPVLRTALGVYEKTNGKWAESRAGQNGEPNKGGGLRKSHGLQGPIDDAFTDSFLCVKGTGAPFNELTGKFAQAQLARFAKEWDKWMRGSLPVKADTEVTEADIRTKNLILFGDPSSNALIDKVLLKLPIAWTREQLTINGRKFESDKHLPILIYPNPLNPRKYVVLNSGHTFHEAEFKGSNALLFPHLGDYAVVRPTPTAKDPAGFEKVAGGIFDDSWGFHRDD